jgi:hypothetical protein
MEKAPMASMRAPAPRTQRRSRPVNGRVLVGAGALGLIVTGVPIAFAGAVLFVGFAGVVVVGGGGVWL